MLRSSFYFTFFLAMSASQLAYAEFHCESLTLSDKQVKEIVDSARKTMSSLPPPFSQTDWTVKKEGCSYNYIESSVPAAFNRVNVIKLNAAGVVVDSTPGSITCPDVVMSDADLTNIVIKARDQFSGLPPKPAKSRIRVERVRCLYQVFEYAVPESRGNFAVFTIDHLGNLLTVLFPDPY